MGYREVKQHLVKREAQLAETAELYRRLEQDVIEARYSYMSELQREIRDRIKRGKLSISEPVGLSGYPANSHKFWLSRDGLTVQRHQGVYRNKEIEVDLGSVSTDIDIFEILKVIRTFELIVGIAETK